MTALSRRRDPLDRPYSLGERLWLARFAHPRSVPLLTWAALLSVLAVLLVVAS